MYIHINTMCFINTDSIDKQTFTLKRYAVYTIYGKG